MLTTMETLTLDCLLTDQEKLEYGREKANLQITVKQKRASLKEFRDRITGEIASAESRSQVLCRALDSGKEFRPVKCRIKRDWKIGRKFWIREDTGKVAKVDIIPEDERQGELGL